MREIKFRAWEKKLKEIIPVDDINFETGTINTKSAWRLFNEIELMQSTGLRDKNGTEIYEGDILHIGYNYLGKIVVKFDNGAYNIAQYKLTKCEVIGNIYANPDLI